MASAAQVLASLDPPAEQQVEITLLELVAAVADAAADDAEVVATVADLINSGKVRLIGHFRGADVQVG